MTGLPCIRARVRLLPLLALGSIPACGDSGDAVTSSTSDASSVTTGGPGSTSNPTSAGPDATSQGSTPTTPATAAAAPAPARPRPTLPAPTTTGASTGEPSTTSSINPSEGTTTTTPAPARARRGPQLDMGPKVCDPDLTPATFDFISIANSSQGTVSKIDTKTGVEQARYYTGPGASNPSRTSVDQLGNVAVSNRDPGSIIKIMALKAKCIDKNNNGMIDTSAGPNDIRPWGNSECVLWSQSFPSRLQLRPAPDRLGGRLAGPEHL